MTAKGRSSYPLYHSMHEVPWTVEKFVSSDGAALATVARFVTEATIRLANQLVRLESALFTRIVNNSGDSLLCSRLCASYIAMANTSPCETRASRTAQVSLQL